MYSIRLLNGFKYYEDHQDKGLQGNYCKQIFNLSKRKIVTHNRYIKKWYKTYRITMVSQRIKWQT